MSHLSKIFAVWEDNAEALASDIGETGVTVRQWRNRGNIHSDHWPKIIKAAAARGVRLRPEDFWPAEVVADLPGHLAGPSGADHCASATKDCDRIANGTGAAGAANNPAENIGSRGSADIAAENIREPSTERVEADSHGPFCSTSSPTTVPSDSSPSTGGALNGAAKASVSCRSSSGSDEAAAA